MSSEPFERGVVLLHARRLLDQDVIVFTGHAKRRAKERGLVTIDIENIILGGVQKQAPRNSPKGWTYCIETQWMSVVVAFRCSSDGKPEELVIVTCWKDKKP